MEEKEILPKNTFASFVLQKIQIYRPDASLAMLGDQSVIVLHTGMDINLRNFQEKYFPDSGQPADEENPYTDAVWKDLDYSGVLPVKRCAEITTNTGEKVYVMSKSEFRILEKKGFFLKISVIESKINEWLDNHVRDDDFNKQKMAGRALIGDYSFIVPMLAGLKPAGDVRSKNWRNKTTLTSKGQVDCFDFFHKLGVLGKIEVMDNHWIYFNPEAVQKLYTQIGLDESVLPEQAVRKILLGRTKNDQFIGMLYGFDKYSVMNYEQPDHAFNEPKFPMSVWDLQYRVADEEKNDAYQKLHSEYEQVFTNIGENLSRGMSPLDALKSIINFAKQKNIHQGVRNSISGI